MDDYRLSGLTGYSFRNVYFAFRQKQDNYIQRPGQDYQPLHSLGLAPGMKLYLTGVKITKKKGFGSFDIAAYWKLKYRGRVKEQGWYILTNLGHRLSKDYERLPEMSEAAIYAVMTRLMLRRLVV